MATLLSHKHLLSLAKVWPRSHQQMFPLEPLPEVTGLREMKFTVHHSSSSHHMVEWARKIRREIDRERECHHENNEPKMATMSTVWELGCEVNYKCAVN